MKTSEVKAPSRGARRFRLLGALLTAVSLALSASRPYLSGWVRASTAVLAVIAVVIGLLRWRSDCALIKASSPVS